MIEGYGVVLHTRKFGLFGICFPEKEGLFGRAKVMHTHNELDN